MDKLNEAVKAYDEARASGANHAQALGAASEVSGLSVVDTLNEFLAAGLLSLTFERNESFKNKECLRLVRGVDSDQRSRVGWNHVRGHEVRGHRDQP